MGFSRQRVLLFHNAIWPLTFVVVTVHTREINKNWNRNCLTMIMICRRSQITTFCETVVQLVRTTLFHDLWPLWNDGLHSVLKLHCKLICLCNPLFVKNYIEKIDRVRKKKTSPTWYFKFEYLGLNMFHDVNILGLVCFTMYDLCEMMICIQFWNCIVTSFFDVAFCLLRIILKIE